MRGQRRAVGGGGGGRGREEDEAGRRGREEEEAALEDGWGEERRKKKWFGWGAERFSCGVEFQPQQVITKRTHLASNLCLVSLIVGLLVFRVRLVGWTLG